MKEEIFLTLIYIGFLVISFFFYKKMLIVKTKWIYLCVPVYLVFVNYYIELFNRIHYYLRDHKILNLELGHGGLLMVLLWVFCYLSAVIIIMIVIYKKTRK